MIFKTFLNIVKNQTVGRTTIRVIFRVPFLRKIFFSKKQKSLQCLFAGSFVELSNGNVFLTLF